MQSRREDTLEEGYAIKLCLKLGKKWERNQTPDEIENATETYGMFHTALRPSFMNPALVFEWHKRFKEDRQSVRDNERYGRSNEISTPELIGQRVRVRIRVTVLRF